MTPTSNPPVPVQPTSYWDYFCWLVVAVFFGWVISTSGSSNTAKSAPAKSTAPAAIVKATPLATKSSPPINGTSGRDHVTIVFPTKPIDTRLNSDATLGFPTSPRDVFPIPTQARTEIAKGNSSTPATLTAATPLNSGAKFDNGLSRYYDPTYRPPVGEHYINGYTRKGGTYVSGHYQTNPDKSFYNNYSTVGNTNPYTGKIGTKLPPSYSSGSRGGKR